MPILPRTKPISLSPVAFYVQRIGRWLGRYWPEVLIGTLGGITLIAWLIVGLA
jgi:hypothetical protein